MFNRIIAIRHPALVVATLIAAAVPVAWAAIFPFCFSSNYTFPDGGAGLALQGFLPAAQNNTYNPGVLVGFNPQPDPPGTPRTFLSLTGPVRREDSGAECGLCRRLRMRRHLAWCMRSAR